MTDEYTKTKEAETECLRVKLFELTEENKRLQELVSRVADKDPVTPKHSCM